MNGKGNHFISLNTNCDLYCNQISLFICIKVIPLRDIVNPIRQNCNANLDVVFCKWMIFGSAMARMSYGNPSKIVRLNNLKKLGQIMNIYMYRSNG